MLTERSEKFTAQMALHQQLVNSTHICHPDITPRAQVSTSAGNLWELEYTNERWRVVWILLDVEVVAEELQLCSAVNNLTKAQLVVDGNWAGCCNQTTTLVTASQVM